MLALTYRLLAEDLEEEGLIFEANQAITSATLHLGACIPSLFIELGKISTFQKRTAALQLNDIKNQDALWSISAV